MPEPIRENNILADDLDTPDALENQLLSLLFELPQKAFFVVVAVDGFDPDRPVSEMYREKEPGIDRLPAVVREAIDSRRIYVDGPGRWVWREAGTGLCRLDSHLRGCSLQGYLRLPNYNPRHNGWVTKRAHEVIETRRMYFRWRLKLTRSERIRRVEMARAEARAAAGASNDHEVTRWQVNDVNQPAVKLHYKKPYSLGDIAAAYGIEGEKARNRLRVRFEDHVKKTRKTMRENGTEPNEIRVFVENNIRKKDHGTHYGYLWSRELESITESFCEDEQARASK